MTEKSKAILAYFDQLLGEVHCELHYRNAFELLIAVMLSAQTTDQRVNLVTPELFAQYPTPEKMAEATVEDIAQIIRSLGLYQNKAKSIHQTARVLVEKYDGVVPSSKEELTSLPGVGVKTANVVRAEYFHLPEIAVDTHVARLAKRLGYAKESDSVEVIEKKLRKSFPQERYILLHHQLIHFGRYYCKAMRPECANCQLKDYCKEKKKK